MKAAIYCRLSKEDEDKIGESESIQNQKSMLLQYAIEKGFDIYQIYSDEDYSGIDRTRPDFNRMLEAARAGEFELILVKTQSRFTRDMELVEKYLHGLFPLWGIRFIAVVDHVDTFDDANKKSRQINGLINEWYLEDLSANVRSVLTHKRRTGQYIAAFPLYGYAKDPADHNHLIIDEKAAPVVKLIFQMALDGAGIGKIRNHLNASHILRPAAYAASERGESGYERHFEGKEDNRYQWSNNSVRAILRSPVYAGNLVGYKRVAVSMKSKKRPSKLPEEWEVIPNTHEGIVTQAQFDIVQRMMTSRRRDKGGSGFDNIFSGILKCADCGYAMRATSANRRKRPNPIDCVQYMCNNYGTNGSKGCSAHSIEARDLFDAVLADIRHFARLAVEGDEKRVRQLQQQLSSIGATEQKALEREKRKLSKRLGELDKLFSALYEDKVMERITERNFDMVPGSTKRNRPNFRPG